MLLVDFFKKNFSKSASPDLKASSYSAPVNYGRYDILDGEKFEGSFGGSRVYSVDRAELIRKSIQLIHDNLYAAGIVDRLVVNIIGKGLTLDSAAESSLIGLSEDDAHSWSDEVEERFRMYSDRPDLVDFYGEKTLGQLQAQREYMAMVEGDVLVVCHTDESTKLPKIQLISGTNVQTPNNYSEPNGNRNRIIDGVELDASGSEVAYHVVKDPDDFDSKMIRIPCVGEKSGRKVAVLYRPLHRLQGQYRGLPLLSHVLYSLKEIDRYRDSVQRKAAHSSSYTMAIERQLGTSLTSEYGVSMSDVNSPDGVKKDACGINFKRYSPGMVIEGLEAGETIKNFNSDSTDLSFADFESAIIRSVSWSLGIPPEILQMSFNSNYSASKNSNAEFNIFLGERRENTTTTNDKPLYELWLTSEVLNGNIQADGFLDSLDDPSKYAVKGGWLKSDWSASIKLNADFVKEVAGWNDAIAGGLATRDMATKALHGKKSRNIAKQLRLENETFAKAVEPLKNLAQGTDAGIMKKVESVVDNDNENN